MADFKDILTENETQLTDDDLLKYLHDEMSAAERTVFEKKVASDFESDALDGLQQIKNKKHLRDDIHQLHKKIPQLLQIKKHRSEKRKLKDFEWIILTIIIILFLCTISYVIITIYNNHVL